jgi:tRNA(fMet)-specific endonuclease VapC
MGYLLDTDWIISFLNGQRYAVELVGELASEGIYVSVITWGEIYEGLVASSVDAERHRQQFDEFTASIDLLSPDLTVARHYGRLRADLRIQGLMIPDNDIWIAATAIADDLTLVSRDRHFSRIPQLKRYPIVE